MRERLLYIIYKYISHTFYILEIRVVYVWLKASEEPRAQAFEELERERGGDEGEGEDDGEDDGSAFSARSIFWVVLV